MADIMRIKRLRDFQCRAHYAPENVYYHRTQGWAYIPVHPFGDEPDLLAQLKLQPMACQIADAWWCIAGDAVLLESAIIGVLSGPPGLFVKAPLSPKRSVGLVAVFDAPFVTRTLFERAMVQFAAAGFPQAAQFQMQQADPPWYLPDTQMT